MAASPEALEAWKNVVNQEILAESDEGEFDH
jgi:hypothetical protein